MIKKTILIALLILFAGVLVAGGVYRTSAKSGYDISLGGETIVEISENSAGAGPRALQAEGTEEHQQGGERAGQGLGNGGSAQGRNAKTEEFAAEGQNGQSRETNEQQGQGRGQGQGQSQESGEQQGQGRGQGQGQSQESGEQQGQGRGQGQGQSQESGEQQGQGRGQGQGQNQESGEQQGQGLGQGQGNGRLDSAEGQQGQERQNGQGNQGGGQGLNQSEERTAQSAEQHESILIEGTISQAPESGVDMIIETALGQVLVGTGPGYLQQQGFDLANGDAVQVSGFFENDEFKATTITRLADGAAIALRDESGRPMWSGAGRRANSGENQS